MNGEERLNRTLALYRLIAQSERLEYALRRAWPAEGDAERRNRLERVYRRCIDRTNRREDAYRRFREGLPAVTTTEVAAWVRGRVAAEWSIDAPDPAQLAGEACDALGLWDEHGSIPQWVYGVCERTAPRAQAEIMRRRAFFVEKKINYTEDGDVLYA